MIYVWYATPNQANRPQELPSIPRPAQVLQLWPRIKTIKFIGQNIQTSKSIGQSEDEKLGLAAFLFPTAHSCYRRRLTIVTSIVVKDLINGRGGCME